MRDSPFSLSCAGEWPDAVATPRPLATCVLCRNWFPMGRRWGRCRSSRIGDYVEMEGHLVTRDSFSCRFFSPVTELWDSPAGGSRP